MLALAWAEYYQRRAAYEARVTVIEARQDRLEDRIRASRKSSGCCWRQMGLVAALERLGPQTLSPEHQATVKAMAGRLHDLAGFSFATICSELNAAFHVGRHSDIPDAQWAGIASWFQTRIDAVAKRRGR